MLVTVMLGDPVNPVALPENCVAVTIPLVASRVMAVPTLTTLLKVAAVPVMILSVLATPVSPEPLPKNDVALITPTTSSFASGDVELRPTLLSPSTVKIG